LTNLKATSIAENKVSVGNRKGMGAQMKLTKLFKDQNSGGNGCPTVYLGDTGELVVQGYQVDAGTYSELENVLPGEQAVRISADVILGAVERYREQIEQAR
jgi:hypothetical protein